MTTVVNTAPSIASRLVTGILSIKPLANLAKQRARAMMIERAERIGVPWTKRVQELRDRDWNNELKKIQNPDLTYPEYYLRSFHAYEQGNLNWEAAWEVEVAAYTVHAGIWPNAGANGDPQLRQSYHDIIKSKIDIQPRDILDLGCSVGMSTFALQDLYPSATLTGLDLSPYFLAVAQHNADRRNAKINWKHAAAEVTELPDASFDLVSAFLMFHELPQAASRQIFHEARRLLRPNGYLTLMDMNPKSEVYAKMPPYILTLLKSTEPYLDEYFTLDIEQELVNAGFHQPVITPNSPRHRTVVAQAK
jgi:ubiquinone/menaquinone biosynthesis C-methylase UbiE